MLGELAQPGAPTAVAAKSGGACAHEESSAAAVRLVPAGGRLATAWDEPFIGVDLGGSPQHAERQHQGGSSAPRELGANSRREAPADSAARVMREGPP
jgi:hypothetical protein